jgi:Type IV secretory pathway, VirB4 components
MHEDDAVLSDAIKAIRRYLEDCGFSCINESINTLDAWLGTIPGHGSANVRRLFINSLTLSHVLPFHTIWAGALHSSKASKLPPQSPPVFYAATTGKTPYRFNIDVADVGHQMVVGTNGSGKSTYLDLLIAQFLRYENAQVFIFDKDHSHQFLTKALGGVYYDIGENDRPLLSPLINLTTSKRKAAAKNLLEMMVELQNTTLTPQMRQEINQAIEQQALKGNFGCDLTTVLGSSINHDGVRQALSFYTTGGQFSLMDAQENHLRFGYLQSFEMGWLLESKAEVYVPVLKYLFDQIELKIKEENGRQPTLIILEEAWLYIANKFFAARLKDWLRTMRKKNARVIFVTQILSDIYKEEGATEATNIIKDSCHTKILLPNANMDKSAEHIYQAIGLNERQIEIIQNAQPKKEYYVVTPEGKRLIDLGFDESLMSLNFLGRDGSWVKALDECQKTYGKDWVYYWLKQNDQPEWADYWWQTYGSQQKATKAQSTIQISDKAEEVIYA